MLELRSNSEKKKKAKLYSEPVEIRFQVLSNYFSHFISSSILAAYILK